jgi:chromosome segregation ATPase
MGKQAAGGEVAECHLASDVSMDAADPVEVVESAAQQQPDTDGVGPTSSEPNTQLGVHTKSAADCGDDEFAVRFSAAQLKAKIAQAKYEAKLAADAELLAVRKELVERRYEVTNRERERDKVAAQCEALQTQLDAVLQEHKQTLSGMRDDLKPEKLLATLDVEKATRQKLQKAFEKQQQALALAQERVEKLDVQVANYQKTETVLAQSVAHLQHRFASKDQQRAASVEHVQRELVEQHEQETTALREELAIARRTEQLAQGQLLALQKELQALRDNEQRVLVSRDTVATREHELQAKISRLETEKAVLQSKAEQVQKADAQLRSQVRAQSEELATLRQEKEALQRDNKELGEIASDLMQMAERQHAENAKHGASPARSTAEASVATPGSTHEEDGLFLQKRKKRLRLSLG